MRHAVLTFTVWLICLCAPVLAQTPQALWDAPANALTLQQAQGLEYRLYVNNAAGVAVQHACTGTAAPFACSAPLPSVVVAALGGLGVHRVEITARDAAAGESPRSAPFSRPVPPVAPTALRVTLPGQP